MTLLKTSPGQYFTLIIRNTTGYFPTQTLCCHDNSSLMHFKHHPLLTKCRSNLRCRLSYFFRARRSRRCTSQRIASRVLSHNCCKTCRLRCSRCINALNWACCMPLRDRLQHLFRVLILNIRRISPASASSRDRLNRLSLQGTS